jgi:hypothetical protein
VIPEPQERPQVGGGAAAEVGLRGRTIDIAVLLSREESERHQGIGDDPERSAQDARGAHELVEVAGPWPSASNRPSSLATNRYFAPRKPLAI